MSPKTAQLITQASILDVCERELVWHACVHTEALLFWHMLTCYIALEYTV